MLNNTLPRKARLLALLFSFTAVTLWSAEQPAPGSVILIEGVGDTDASYHLFVPSTFDGEKKLPLVYAFHPGGDGKAILEQIQPAAERFGWMIAGCNQLRNRMGDPELAAKMTREIMADVEKRVPVAPERIYLAGFSGGAMRSYTITRTFDRSFAGILAFGGWIGNYDEGNVYPSGLAVAMVNGLQDRGAQRYGPRDAALLEPFGITVRSFDFDGGHTVPGPEVIEEAVGWLESIAAPDAASSK